ncbi:glutathione S-transferase family protein [Pyxidicoccus fallax]|uniref:Glutathione S-transferase family protein n=1 Tax=Pyxidicoccus fallax TaxID=394095 RepID=A0A848LAN8_9BACT|nr:glutathione S-transferase C-terminal domain-containing protein [Pyxidicoccus fallax]NMO15556.1 glutathione S-transferase family protein [Pyxidicoccus fallax]NPC82546.1 glutathione S-transferase family protein [Pyxidicoccus fallax]
MRTLYGLGYSGWTEKARWALDHHRVTYRYREHMPLIGEPVLRWRTARGVRPSVPLLLDEEGSITGSFHIAKRAEAVGQGEPLFPPDAEDLNVRWEETGERVLGVARAHVVVGLLQNRRAQEESLPAFVPSWLRGLMAPSARMGARFIARKHRARGDVDAAIQETVVPALEQLRAALAGRPYLHGRFTYADINAAAMLQFLRPVDDRYLPLGPGTREVWTHAPLAARYSDLLAWRDDLYAKHRKP